jgi:distribution and morphology protein 31
MDLRLSHLGDRCAGHVRGFTYRFEDLADFGSFESAIVPKWGSSTICFRNVYVSRRPNDPSEPADSKRQKGTRGKKSSTAGDNTPAPIPFLSSALTPDTYFAPPAADSDNYTMFDVNLEEVEVTLSFMRWLDGKGLVKDAKVKGVRGVVGECRVELCPSELLVGSKLGLDPADLCRSSICMVGSIKAIVASGFPTRYSARRL